MTMQQAMAKGFIKTQFLSAFLSGEYVQIFALKEACKQHFPDLDIPWTNRYISVQVAQYADL